MYARSYKLNIYTKLTITGIMSLIVSGVLSVVLSANALAAYPEEYCQFKTASDKKSIRASCTDDTSNGSFDGKIFSRQIAGAGNKYTLTEKSEDLTTTRVLEGDHATCTSTITVTKDKATIEGSYLVITESGSSGGSGGIVGGIQKVSYKCNKLVNQKIPLDQENVRDTAWAKAFEKELATALKSAACSKSDTRCQERVSAAIQACTLRVPFTSNEQYASQVKSCLYDNSGATKAQVNTAIEKATSAADEAEESIEDFEGDTAKGDDSTTCAIDGIGWIICPIMNFMAVLNDQAFGFIKNFLGIQPRLFTDKGTEQAWQAFRDIANVLFVIAFMVIVYSQITSAGISNYGVKRMLPRLFIAAVLVNVSFWLCAIAVDISNILGNSLYAFFENLNVGKGAGSTVGEGAWENTIGPVLAGVAAVALLAAFVISLPALLAFALVMLILIARQAFVILLIVVAPIAFVAYLLPNTEQWFKKWWKMFVTILMVYPVIAVIFGASTLASTILFNVAGDDNKMTAIVALGVLAIPLFAVPVVLKGAMGAAGSVGAKLSGYADKAQGAATGRSKKKFMDGRAGEAKRAWESRRQRARVNRRLGQGKLASWGKDKDNPLGRAAVIAGTMSSRLDRSRLGRTVGGDRGAAAAVAQLHSLNKEDVERSMAMLQHGDAGGLIGRAQIQLINANKNGDAIAARAATQILASQTGSKGVDALNSTIRHIESTTGGMNDKVVDDIKVDINGAGLKGKDRALDNWSRSKDNLQAVSTSLDATKGLNESEIAGQSEYQLHTFATTGSLSQDQAQRVMAAHANGTIHLDDKKYAILNAVANNSPLPTAPTPTAPRPPKP